MWYFAKILFARDPAKCKHRVLCETCHVLLWAPTAMKAYGKAQTWAAKHVQGSEFHLVGIQHLNDILDKKIGDGTEIGGSFFYKVDPWKHKDRLIPNRNEIPIIRLEAHPATPVGGIIAQGQVRMVKALFGGTQPDGCAAKSKRGSRQPSRAARRS